MKGLKIYLARPMGGHTFKEVYDYYKNMKIELGVVGFDVLSPIVEFEELKSHMKEDDQLTCFGYNTPTSTNRAIVGRDKWLVKQSDVIFVNFIGCKKVSIGSIFEFAWAHDNGKHVVVAMDKNNVHVHAFTLECADVIFESQEDAIKYLKTLTN